MEVPVHRRLDRRPRRRDRARREHHLLLRPCRDGTLTVLGCDGSYRRPRGCGQRLPGEVGRGDDLAGRRPGDLRPSPGGARPRRHRRRRPLPRAPRPLDRPRVLRGVAATAAGGGAVPRLAPPGLRERSYFADSTVRSTGARSARAGIHDRRARPACRFAATDHGPPTLAVRIDDARTPIPATRPLVLLGRHRPRAGRSRRLGRGHRHLPLRGHPHEGPRGRAPAPERAPGRAHGRSGRAWAIWCVTHRWPTVTPSALAARGGRGVRAAGPPGRARHELRVVSRVADRRRQAKRERGDRPNGPAGPARATAAPLDELRPVSFDRDFTEFAAGLGARDDGPDQGAVHRVGRRPGPAVDAGHRQGLGDRRVLDAPGLHARAGRPRGGQGPPVGPDPGDPAADRPLAAGGVRPGGAGRDPGHRRLRRPAGRRRHPHRVDLRRLRRPARRLAPGCVQARVLAAHPLTDEVAAVSVGIVDAVPMLDLPYAEDSRAEVDMNVVMTGSGRFVEVQGTAERMAFSRDELDELLALAEGGIAQLVEAQRGGPGRAAGAAVTAGRPDCDARPRHAPTRTRRPRSATILGEAGIAVLPAPPTVPEVEETGDTLDENARLKARGARAATGPAGRRRRHRARGRRAGRRARRVLGPLRRRARHLRRQRGQAAGRARQPRRPRRARGPAS